MNLSERIVNGIIKGLVRTVCRIDAEQLSRVPREGPLLLISNHVNFLDIPIMVTHLHPRRLTGYVKAETWDNPLMGFLFDLWGGIPIHRGTADMEAIRRGLKALRDGYILGVAPEGTRGGDGILQPAHPGVVILALHSGAPILPAAYYGGESFWQNFNRLRRTDFHIVVGRPFKLRNQGVSVTRAVRRQMLDEIMYQLSALLPHDYRGPYADMGRATEKYLHFPPGSRSNLIME